MQTQPVSGEYEGELHHSALYGVLGKLQKAVACPWLLGWCLNPFLGSRGFLCYSTPLLYKYPLL